VCSGASLGGARPGVTGPRCDRVEGQRLLRVSRASSGLPP
jgi:hypothetical protein